MANENFFLNSENPLAALTKWLDGAPINWLSKAPDAKAAIEFFASQGDEPSGGEQTNDPVIPEGTVYFWDPVDYNAYFDIAREDFDAKPADQVLQIFEDNVFAHQLPMQGFTPPADDTPLDEVAAALRAWIYEAFPTGARVGNRPPDSDDRPPLN